MNCDKCDTKLRTIYENLWGGDFNPSAEYKRGKSYKFKGEVGEHGELFQKIFEVSNPDRFEKKYAQAVSGSGDEAKKIAAFHSSSRCSLMIFYNVEEKPIQIEIDGKNVVFNKSLFEVKNPVIGAPSNMDVVLISDDEKIVLFLESKFSEYIVSESLVEEGISKRYLDKFDFSKKLYEDSFLKELSVRKKISENEKTFSIVSADGEKVYLHGLKQMISHYIGIQRRLHGDKRKEDNRPEVQDMLRIMNKQDCFVYLGEILFDFQNKDNDIVFEPGISFKKYSDKYKILAKRMNQINKYPNKFKVLNSDLKYSDLITNNLDSFDEKTLWFYGFAQR